jgi:hypothetical protein
MLKENAMKNYLLKYVLYGTTRKIQNKLAFTIMSLCGEFQSTFSKQRIIQ